MTDAPSRGITGADLRNALVWAPVVTALGYGVYQWAQVQTQMADMNSRLTAIESLVTIDRIREQTARRVNMERDIAELRKEIGRLQK